MSDFNPRFHLDSEQDHHLVPRDRCTICSLIVWCLAAFVFGFTIYWGVK